MSCATCLMQLHKFAVVVSHATEFQLLTIVAKPKISSSATCSTFTITFSKNSSVFVCVVGFLDPSTRDPNFCTNLLPITNWNGCLSIDPNLLVGTCSFGGLKIAKGVCVSTLSICTLIACKLLCVCWYYYCCYCCCYCKCCGLLMVSI